MMTSRFLRFPSRQGGWLSLALAAAFGGLLALFFASWAAGVGPEHAEQFFDNPFLAWTLLFAAGSGIMAGAAAAYAMVFTGERSLLVMAAFLGGLFVLLFSISEVIGHEEPRGSSSTPGSGHNGHFNLSAVDVGPDQVRVNFDYTYRGDPPGTAITALAVTPLGPGGQPLEGYQPAETAVAHGTHHVSLVLDFSAEQKRELKGFSVCFTGSGQPDLGCRTVDYEPD
jgi:hypothetical protein